MRRKSTRLDSFVKVNIEVIPQGADLRLEVFVISFVSSLNLHSIVSSTTIGAPFFEDCIQVSIISKQYCGSAETAERI